MMTLQTANELNVEPNEQFDRNKVTVNLKEEKSHSMKSIFYHVNRISFISVERPKPPRLEAY